jgi:hypothetical protein
VLSELIAVAMGISVGEILGASEKFERALGSLLLRYGRIVDIQGTGDGIDPMIEMRVKIDLRKLKTTLTT